MTRRQLAALASGSLEMGAALARHDTARAPLTPDEIVAIREPCPSADPREQDMPFAQALIATPASYAAALLAPMTDQP